MRSIFGWSLPPGVSMRDIDPPEGPCDVCGKSVDKCICPECPQCSSFGDPKCYDEHGLVRTPEQIQSKADTDAKAKADIDAENAMYEQMAKEAKEFEDTHADSPLLEDY